MSCNGWPDNTATPTVSPESGFLGWSAERAAGPAQRRLSEPREVDRLTEDSHCLLRRVEAHRVLGLDEVHVELSAALVLPPLAQLLVGASLALGRLEIGDQIHQRVHGQVPHPEGPVLDGLHPREELLL